MKKTYTVRSKYLADALAFLGFKYKAQGGRDRIVFEFEDTEKFRKYLTAITSLKQQAEND